MSSSTDSPTPSLPLQAGYPAVLHQAQFESSTLNFIDLSVTL